MFRSLIRIYIEGWLWLCTEKPGARRSTRCRLIHLGASDGLGRTMELSHKRLGRQGALHSGRLLGKFIPAVMPLAFWTARFRSGLPSGTVTLWRYSSHALWCPLPLTPPPHPTPTHITPPASPAVRLSQNVSRDKPGSCRRRT